MKTSEERPFSPNYSGFLLTMSRLFSPLLHGQNYAFTVVNVDTLVLSLSGRLDFEGASFLIYTPVEAPFFWVVCLTCLSLP